MSSKVVGNRIEPVRTRKASKTEKKKSGMSDIKEAFKMAADKRSDNSNNNDKETKHTQEQEATAEKSTDQTLLEQIEDSQVEIAVTTTEIAIQVTPIELALENESEEATHQVKHVGLSIDLDKEQILDALQELTEKFTKLEEVLNDSKKGVSAQVLSLMLKTDNLHSDIHGGEDGILAKMLKIQDTTDGISLTTQQMEENQTRLTKMLAENKRLSRDLVTTQGLLQKYSQKIQGLEQKVMDLTRRGMEQNLIFHAVEESPDEDCFYVVSEFVKEYLQFEIDEEDVWKAYRMGVPRQNRARALFVKLSYYARDKIMDKVGMLKGKKNRHGHTLFIGEQIPDGIVKQRKIWGKRAATLKKIEDKKPKEQQRPVKILRDKVVVGGQIYKPEVQTPQPIDLFPSVEEQKKINNMARQLREAEPIYSFNGTFVSLAVEVKDVQEVNHAYKAVMQRFPYMDHVMMAYQLEIENNDNKQIKFGSCDDNEHGGGSALCKMLYEQKFQNVAVFVVRRYGGIHLGMNRFTMIENAAKHAIQLLRPSAAPGPP